MLKSFRPKYVRHDFSWFFFTTSKILTYYVAKDESSLAISFIRHLWNCKQMRKVKWKNLELIQVLKNQNISNIWDKKASRHPHKLCGIKIIITKGRVARPGVPSIVNHQEEQFLLHNQKNTYSFFKKVQIFQASYKKGSRHPHKQRKARHHLHQLIHLLTKRGQTRSNCWITEKNLLVSQKKTISVLLKWQRFSTWQVAFLYHVASYFQNSNKWNLMSSISGKPNPAFLQKIYSITIDQNLLVRMWNFLKTTIFCVH